MAGKISETLKVLFDDDPLMLKDATQRTYCGLLLKHLLLDRTMGDSVPEPIDLLNAASRAKMARQTSVRSPVLTDEQKLEYRQSIERRTQLQDPELFSLLKGLTQVSRGELTTNRVKSAGGTFEVHDVAERWLQETGSNSTIDRRLRIAAIGYRVKISQLQGEAVCGEDLWMSPPARSVTGSDEWAYDHGVTELAKEANVEQWADVVLQHIRTALMKKSHIIMLPEFCLPPEVPGAPSIVPRIEQLCRESAERNCLIFAGSRHENGYNRGLVLYYDGTEVSRPWWHYKFASARTLGENLTGPYGNKIPSYFVDLYGDNELTELVIAICYDTFDPSMFLKLVDIGTQGSGFPQIIIVPSFNRSEDFVDLLRDLSYLVNCPVVYVNGLHGDARMFISGFALLDLVGRQDDLNRQIVARLVELAKRNKTAGLQQTLTNSSRTTRRSSAPHETDKATILKSMQRLISDNSTTHTLDHLITVEPCEFCESRQAHPNGRCDKDIIYYNIDTHLIDQLRRFRQTYFFPEKYLPRSLRLKSLDSDDDSPDFF